MTNPFNHQTRAAGATLLTASRRLGELISWRSHLLGGHGCERLRVGRGREWPSNKSSRGAPCDGSMVSQHPELPAHHNMLRRGASLFSLSSVRNPQPYAFKQAPGQLLLPASSRPPSQRLLSTTASPASRPKRRKRVVVGVTGATGAPLAVGLLQRLKHLDVETHLIMSKWGAATLKYELEAPNNTPAYLSSLASTTYSALDVSAPPSSGSFRADAMIVVPCSMKTLAAVRMGYDADLISRAAGVTLKERRRLVLAVRETPLNDVHLENMLGVSRAGAVLFPPVMAFYTQPRCIADMVDQSVKRMVDLLGLGLAEHDDDEELRWSGFEWAKK
ncbi:flavoprotein [Plectosphaerella plurivora]|uniref:Flavin prenyltransferase PAD1, mitochondrial n=1 Tax=Plectosphaerella plurivora TaxID=936078 RepID=A0A9P8V8B4_9PEZI|nr:flavoprotein [Plectosphaerella plurivora]